MKRVAAIALASAAFMACGGTDPLPLGSLCGPPAAVRQPGARCAPLIAPADERFARPVALGPSDWGVVRATSGALAPDHDVLVLDEQSSVRLAFELAPSIDHVVRAWLLLFPHPDAHGDGGKGLLVAHVTHGFDSRSAFAPAPALGMSAPVAEARLEGEHRRPLILDITEPVRRAITSDARQISVALSAVFDEPFARLLLASPRLPNRRLRPRLGLLVR